MKTRKEIQEDLIGLIGAEHVLTDEETLKQFSCDRWLKYQYVHDVYTRPTPAAVAYVQDTEQVAEVLKYLNENKINCVPRTGASATEGGLETLVRDSVVVDGSQMNKILNFDPYNMQVTVQCGVGLQVLDDFLREKGFTTGHSPQSKPLAQMGGLTATRSIGQFSTLYGGIEDMVAGLEAVFPDGEVVRVKSVPRRAAGPDIRHIIIGNEGALCFITEVTVKIFPYFPDNYHTRGYLVNDMHTGLGILREVMVEGYKPSVARLYDIGDSEYYFSAIEKDQCVMVFVSEGPAEISEATIKAIDRIALERGAQPADADYIANWFAHLNWDPANIQAEVDEILSTNNLGFTTEISGNWEVVEKIYDVCIKRIAKEVPDLTMLGAHSSHSYINGTNMYFMYYYNVNCGITEEVKKYHARINAIIVEETIRLGGSMVHHHGIGKGRAAWTKEEHGSAYMLLEGLKKQFDPNGIMNCGTIFASDLY